MENMGFVITIDGPAASGKSSVSRELAKKLNCNWVSTGAFYRGLALYALKKNIDLNNVTQLTDLAQSSEWSVKMSADRTLVLINQNDVTDQIASEDVGQVASLISHYPQVRQCLLDHQRNCALGPVGLIAEGRDCGTVVFPRAEAKVYLTANSADRAKRRAIEHGLDEKDLMSAQKVRDDQDSKRAVAPLQVPENAFVLDTTEFSIDQVVKKVLEFTKNKIH
jgi:cytidylate kinase